MSGAYGMGLTCICQGFATTMACVNPNAEILISIISQCLQPKCQVVRVINPMLGALMVTMSIDYVMSG